jgi:DNA-binding CsgD family transcriptional regulator
MSDALLNTAFVVLCDWRGRCVWLSSEELLTKPGDLLWEYLSEPSQEVVRDLLARVVALKEASRFQVTSREGDFFRGWLWPLDSPAVAVCVLAIRVPADLNLLTERERECLEFLARGIETKQIADQLNVSVSTIHTHMKRAREKMGLSTVEELIAFAARHCYPASEPLVGVPIEGAS